MSDFNCSIYLDILIDNHNFLFRLLNSSLSVRLRACKLMLPMPLSIWRHHSERKAFIWRRVPSEPNKKGPCQFLFSWRLKYMSWGRGFIQQVLWVVKFIDWPSLCMHCLEICVEICANLPKIFFDDQVSYYKLRKKKFLVDNRIVFDKPRFLGSEVLLLFSSDDICSNATITILLSLSHIAERKIFTQIPKEPSSAFLGP